MLLFSVLILVLLNYNVYKQEKIKTTGKPLLLELSPVDPRSFMQGDYMSLRYVIEQSASLKGTNSDKQQGYLVICPDKDNVAQFIRFHNNESLAPEERLLSFRKYHQQIQIIPDAFFFQEGHGKYYERAKYGIFNFDDKGQYLLVGLADANGKEILKNK